MSSGVAVSRSDILSLVDQRAADVRAFLELAASHERVGGWQPKGVRARTARAACACLKRANTGSIRHRADCAY
jgi:hypothetical protein